LKAIFSFQTILQEDITRSLSYTSDIIYD